MPKAIVSHTAHNLPQPVVVPKRPHLVKLPSGRFFEFGNVIDAHWEDDDFLVFQAVGGPVRQGLFTGDDANAAEVVMNGIAGIVLQPKPPTEPAIVTARQMPKVN